MTEWDRTRRYLVFLVGLMCVSCGVALITKADLGTSPIAAIPYSLTLILPVMTMGRWMIVFNLLLVLLQLALLRRAADWRDLALQSVITLGFGSLVDVALTALRAVVPGSYPEKLGLLLIGCCVLALGAWLEVVADVVMLPGDAFTRVLARVTGIEFGKVRVVSDVTMSAIAAALCLVFLRALVGVREGTLISALLVGNIIRAYARLLGPLARRLVGEKTGKTTEKA